MGNFASLISPPKSLFTTEQIPDLAGQVVIVTGGNTGIGKETCKALLSKNAKVYLAARSKAKADDAIQWLKNETNGKTAIFLQLDLAEFASIRKAAEEFKSKEQELHVLFNNAGVMVPPVERRTTDGYDLQFGTNVLGHYLLTSLLLPTLIHTAKHSTTSGQHSGHIGGYARVIHTSSAAMKRPPRGGIAWETLGANQASLDACARVGKFTLYCQSKLGNVLFSNELAKRYADQGVISVSVHPGAIVTELARDICIPHWVQVLVMKLFLNVLIFPASQGALTQLYAGTVPEPEHLNGKFLIPWARIGDSGPTAKDEKLGEKLWTWCEEQVKHASEN
ncbi:hypothetical protein FRC10_002026 [Ceratobasidium sp. 414]|nr:hypothetical protein FRC10_002026 [Ceratobasidium sp. 414]